MLFALLLADLAAAAPFVTSWRTTTANETIELPTIHSQSDLTIDWGDLTSAEFFASGDGVLSHIFESPATYTVSIEGQFYWENAYALSIDGYPIPCKPTTTTLQFIDIVSWGDGILGMSSMFAHFPNLQVSAPPNTQPVFSPGTTLDILFYNTSFNSPLDWDLLNVTGLGSMFGLTPLNQPITFRNTQGVLYIGGLFSEAAQFNQPFHFDATSAITANAMFLNAVSFNSILNLTNTNQLMRTDYMFQGAVSFNQPITFDTPLVEYMDGMFLNASSFNQPVEFDTSLVTTMDYMFHGASSFNQPINFDSPLLTSAGSMFADAVSFNQPVVMNTSSVNYMNSMFYGATSFASTVSFTSTAEVTDMDHMFDGASQFAQDLSSWDTALVTQCDSFCLYCGLSTFPSCDPCGSTRLTNDEHMSVCSTRAPTTAAPSLSPTTRSPSASPTTASPSIAPTSAPSAAPSVAPSAAPSPAPSSAPSVAPSVASTAAPSVAPSAAPPAAVSLAAAAAPSLACGLVLALVLGL